MLTSQENIIHKLEDYQPLEYKMVHVNLEIDLSQTPVHVKSALIMQPNSESSTESHVLTLDGQNMDLLSVKLNGRPLTPDDYELTPTALSIKNIPPQENFTVETETTLKDNPDLFGLYETENVILVKAESQGMRRVFYGVDRPDNLATYTTTIIADKKNHPILLSNGTKVAAEELNDGNHSVTWVDLVPKPSYLFALVAGNLEQTTTTYVTTSGRHLPIEFYVAKKDVAKCDYAKEVLKKAMQFDEKVFGLKCDLTQHMIAGVNKYASGASEPTGLNLFNTQFLFASLDSSASKDFLRTAEVVSHEFFHYWSGDRVTIRDWFNLTVKEGLTDFRTLLFLMYLFGEEVARFYNVNVSSDEVSRPNSYVSPRNVYTNAAYNKSGNLFKIMLSSVGKENFITTLRQFYLEHDGKAVTLEELIAFLNQEISTLLPPHLSFSDFLPWFTVGGIPEVTLTDRYHAETHTYQLHVSVKDTVNRMIPLSIGLLDLEGKEVLSNKIIFVTEAQQTFNFDNLTSKPVLALERDFDSPVKLIYNYSPNELLVLLKSDPCFFVRYKANKQLLLSVINEYYKNGEYHFGKEFNEVYRALFNDSTADPWLLAKVLDVPSEESLLAEVTFSEFEKITKARQLFITQIASELQDTLKELYAKLRMTQPISDPTFTLFDIRDAGKKQLAYVCLCYLAAIDKEYVKREAWMLFKHSLGANMNATMQALSLLCNLNVPELPSIFQECYAAWHEDANSMTNWFAMQASLHVDTVTDQVKSLMDHPSFDLTVPNKVLALFRPYIQNPFGFHAESGEGYQFVSDVIVQLDNINPNVAAALAKNFIQWDKYNDARQNKMYKCLLNLDKEIKSPIVKEIIQKGITKGQPKNFFLTSQMSMWIDKKTSEEAVASILDKLQI